MSFKVCNLGSKRPHFHSAYVLRVYNNLGTTVSVLRGTRLKMTQIKNCRDWVEYFEENPSCVSWSQNGISTKNLNEDFEPTSFLNTLLLTSISTSESLKDFSYTVHIETAVLFFDTFQIDSNLSSKSIFTTTLHNPLENIFVIWILEE